MTKNLRKKRKLTDFGLCRTSAEAKAELKALIIMAQDQNYRRLNRGIEKGYVKISNNPALKYEMIRDRSDMTFVHDDYWKALKVSAAWVEENLPDECTEIHSDLLIAQYEGAMVTLEWLLGERNEDLAAHVTSLRFDFGKDENNTETNVSINRTRSGGLPRTKSEVNIQFNTIQLQRAVVERKHIMRGIDNKTLIISEEASPKEDIGGYVSKNNTTLMHKKYWKTVSALAAHAEEKLPPEHLKVLDYLEAMRLEGASATLAWAIGLEKEPLHTFLISQYLSKPFIRL